MIRDEEDDDLRKTPPQPLMFMPLTLLAWLTRTKVISLVLTATRKITMQQNIPSQRKTAIQKTSDSLDNFRFGD